MTLLDREILKSFHVAQTKYEYQLSSYKVTDFVKTLMHNVYHEAIEKTTKNITHYEKDIYSRHINEGVLFLKVTYTTIPIHQIHIVNAIRNRKEVFRRSSGKFAIQNDYVNMELHVIDGNVTLLSEGDDLTKVWESILEINNIIISTSEHYLQGAWIICPNCVRKGNIDPCKYPLELLESTSIKRWSHTGCKHESSSFRMPVSLLYPMHKGKDKGLVEYFLHI